MSRERLPNRRTHEVLTFSVEGIEYTATVSRFRDGRVGEIFIDPTVKSGSALQTMARDLAIAASLALQHGATVQQLRKALTAATDPLSPGSPAGVLFAVLDG